MNAPAPIADKAAVEGSVNAPPSADAAPAPNAWGLLVAFGVMTWSAAAGPHIFDTGELAAAGWELGGSHGPGQPLHALLSHVAAWFPFGPIPWRMSLLSAAFAVAAAWTAGKLASELAVLVDVDRGLARRCLPDAVAFAVLIGPTLLRQSLRIEVYSLALALTLASVRALVQWGAWKKPGALPSAGFLAGMAVATHPPHALVAVLIGAIWLAMVLRDGTRRGAALRGVAWAALACIVAMGMLYAYLPIRAHAGAGMWGDLTNWKGFVTYVTGGAYQQNLGVAGSSLDVFGQVSGVVLYVSIASGLVPVLGVAIFAAKLIESRIAQAGAGAATLAMPVAAVVAACLQPLSLHNPDNVAYAGPAVALLIIVGGVGLAWLSAMAAARLAAVILIVTMGLNLPAWRNLASELRGGLPELETLTGALTDTPPARSLVVVTTDFTAGAWMMARVIDGARPDVALFVSGLSTSSWHWETLASHPAYSGRPIRSREQNNRIAFTRGAILNAYNHFPVLAEQSEYVQGMGSVAGPYLLLAADDVPTRDPRWTASVGERLLSGDNGAWSTREYGDFDAGGSILRIVHIERARRLALRGFGKDAFASLLDTMHWLPKDATAPITASTATKLERRPTSVIHDPDGFLATPEDVVREAAVMLWAFGDATGARALLQAQRERHDPRALLQLAWLDFAEGHGDAAMKTVEAFATMAPSLLPEAKPLATAMEQAAPKAP